MARAQVFYDQITGKDMCEGILGRGAFGVAKIVQWQDGSSDAVKIEGVDPALEEDREIEMLIMRELGYLKAAFVRERQDDTEWIGTRDISDKQYTVQERHAGIELYDYFSSIFLGAMSIEAKLEIALKSALAIQKLHEKGIIHADIKPQNFMINMKGMIAVNEAIDFGFSMKLEVGKTEKKLKFVMGTQGYIAPEVYQGKYSKASDVYALGVMFRDDLKLSGFGLSEMVQAMTNLTDAKLRPTVDEVAKVLMLRAIPCMGL